MVYMVLKIGNYDYPEIVKRVHQCAVSLSKQNFCQQALVYEGRVVALGSIDR